jgi:aminoglycoside phosphotransferase (APT) family kinase protein
MDENTGSPARSAEILALLRGAGGRWSRDTPACLCHCTSGVHRGNADIEQTGKDVNIVTNGRSLRSVVGHRRGQASTRADTERSDASPDDTALANGLGRWLADHRRLTDPEVGNLSRPSAGYSSETIFMDLAWRDEEGEHLSPLVVRMAPPLVGTFPHYDLVSQWQAQTAAAAVGVPVADPVVETDTRWVGAPFMVMPRVDGRIVGALDHRDPWLNALAPAGRGQVYDGFLSTLATIHRADPKTAVDVPRRDNAAELDYWDEYLSWSSDGHPVPALAEGLRWCRRHRPPDEPPAALLWGDVRFENMVLGDDLHPLAVLDWDMTSIGAPEHDLAWFTSLGFTMHQLFGRRPGGFPDRDGTVARFEELSGRPVRDLEWYETLAMVRSTAVMTRISFLRRDAGEPLMLPIEDNVILDLLTARLA